MKPFQWALMGMVILNAILLGWQLARQELGWVAVDSVTICLYMLGINREGKRHDT